MAKPERKGFASPAYEVEPNLVGTVSIWGRVDEMMGQWESLIADVKTHNWVFILAHHTIAHIHQQDTRVATAARLPKNSQLFPSAINTTCGEV